MIRELVRAIHLIEYSKVDLAIPRQSEAIICVALFNGS